MITEYQRQIILSLYFCPKIYGKSDGRRDIKKIAKTAGVSRPVVYKEVKIFLKTELKKFTHWILVVDNWYLTSWKRYFKM